MMKMLYPVENRFREVKDISGIWSFRADADGTGHNEKWYLTKLRDSIPMPVPSSYNDITQVASLRDHIGDVWYQTEFYVPKAWEKERTVLRFGSVTHKAEVWLNGEYLTAHKGGYLPFEADISHVAKFGEKNLLTVSVNNVLDFTTIPIGEIEEYDDARHPKGFKRQIIHHDFFNYAGIHRPVKLYKTAASYVSDVLIHTDIKGTDGIVKYNASVVGSGSIRVELLDENESIAASAVGAEGCLVVPNAHFWNVGDGYLYTLRIILENNGAEIDSYEQKCGIRTFRVNGNALELNGKRVYLKGFGRHEDSDIRGKGMDNVTNIKDLNIMKWIGANSFRTSHYPYSEEIMDIADREGFLVIDECTAVGYNFWNEKRTVFCPERVSDAALSHHLDVMRELIDRDKNRPSVVMWSVANEAVTYEEGAVPYFEKVISETRRLDPTRPVMIVESSRPHNCRVAQMVDVIGVNRYYTWYSDSGCIEIAEHQVREELEGWYNRFGKPVMMTEFGADAIAGFHSDPPQMFSEEYQRDLIEHYAHVFDTLDFLVGEHVWNLCDFNTKQGTTRVMGNRKGIFTRQRQPKMAARFLRDRWKTIE
mgnify:FL=1